ncbi:MAG: hypothetical protein VB017_05515 [Endomicrobiaceae bacterium]|nr:hypothetical protein [Endomicrobiaceae bacterium]
MAVELIDDRNDNKDKCSKVITDFKYAFSYWEKWGKEALNDLQTSLGDMVDEDAKEKLSKRGIKQLVINKIIPNIRLLGGLEVQNRTDFAVMPEGEEDDIKAEIVSRLLKNIVKRSNADRKLSDGFELKLSTGVSYLKPYIDYTEDLVNGNLKLKLASPFTVFVDPDSCELDLSDAKYVIEITSGLSKEQVKELFPDYDTIIDNCENGTVNMLEQGYKTESSKNNTDQYKNKDSDGTNGATKRLYDIVEYHYKKSVPKWYVVDTVSTTITPFESEAAAEEHLQTILSSKYKNEMLERYGAESTEYLSLFDEKQKKKKYESETIKIIKRFTSEIWTTVLLGEDTFIKDERCWCYPNWKSYPIIPDFAFKTPIKIPKNGKQHFAVKGIVRDVKDLNFELNKRRTQSLHHINSSANSGWLMQEGSVTDENVYREFGSSPGVVLKYKAGKDKPTKIEPTQLSSAHEILAKENAQDIKEVSGINTDLLAMNESQASGRAIALRQKQGLVMVQKIFDNFAFSKQILGRFLTSQLKEVFDITEAKKVLGKQFLVDNFGIQNNLGQIIIDEQTFTALMEEIFNPDELQKFDVSLSETPQSDTLKIANYNMLVDLAKNGMPIPQEVLIDESMLPKATREKIKAAILQAQQAQQPQQ